MSLIVFLDLSATRAAMIHEWNFNETSGTVLQDSVGGANASVIVLGGGGSFQLMGSAVRLDGGARGTADYVSFPPMFLTV